jgi:hypothetical protein
VLAAAPPAVIVRTAALVADDLDVPYWDDWDLAPVADAAAGHLAVETLWAQHLEARPVLPRLILTAVALLTRWDLRWQAAVNVALSLAALAALAALLRLTVRPWSAQLAGWLTLVASLLTFSLARYEAWFWAACLATVLSGLGASAALVAVAWRGRSGLGPWLALLAGIAATLSLPNGLAVLALVPLGLALAARPPRMPAERRAPAIVAGAGALVAALYAVGFAVPDVSAISLAAPRPTVIAAFALVYLGAPFGAPSVLTSLLAGAAGGALLLGAGGWLWQRHRDRRDTVLAWFLLASFAILTAGMAAVGRSRFGAEHALASRYQTFSMLFWVSVAVVVALAARTMLAARLGRPRRLALGAALAALASLAVVGYARAWSSADEALALRREALRRGRECVRFYRVAPDECLALIYPDPGAVRARARRLEALGLGPFAPGRHEPSLSAHVLAPDPGAGSLDRVQTGDAVIVNPASATYRAREIVVSGWAIDPAAARPAPAVLVAVDGEIVGRTSPGLHRADVARALGDRRLLPSGWVFRFGAFRLTPGRHSVEAYAVRHDGRLAPLRPAWSIAVREP